MKAYDIPPLPEPMPGDGSPEAIRQRLLAGLLEKVNKGRRPKTPARQRGKAITLAGSRQGGRGTPRLGASARHQWSASDDRLLQRFAPGGIDNCVAALRARGCRVNKTAVRARALRIGALFGKVK